MYTRQHQPYLHWGIATFVVLLVGLLIYRLDTVLTPFITAAILAYILNPLVTQLIKLKFSRNMAAAVATVFAGALVIGLVLFIIPMMVKQMDAIWEKIPQMMHYLQNTLVPWINQTFNVKWELDAKMLTQYVMQNGGQIRAALVKLMPVLANQGSVFALMLMNLFLLPILLYYFLVDWPRWSDGMYAMVPRRYVKQCLRIGNEINQTLGEYLRGQLLVMLIVGLIYGGGLALVGLESGFAIGMLAGILVVIPYVGALIGLLMATLAALLQFGSLGGLVSVWAVFLTGQLLESYVITPRFVGERIGLSPLWVIFALMAFGQLLGFVGMLLALPLAAICLVLLRELTQYYYNSRFYRRQNSD